MDALQSLYYEIKNLIDEGVGEPGHEYEYGKFKGLGWLDFDYANTNYEGPFPRISLKLQKNAVHVYVMMWIDGKPILENYVNIFGKSAVGKGCLRIKKLNDERKRALEEIIMITKRLCSDV